MASKVINWDKCCAVKNDATLQRNGLIGKGPFPKKDQFLFTHFAAEWLRKMSFGLLTNKSLSAPFWAKRMLPLADCLLPKWFTLQSGHQASIISNSCACLAKNSWDPFFSRSAYTPDKSVCGRLPCSRNERRRFQGAVRIGHKNPTQEEQLSFQKSSREGLHVCLASHFLI